MIIDVTTDAPHALDLACDLLSKGKVIAVPTETVYGLAADAFNPLAVRRIFQMKGRPAHNPLICHCADIGMARTIAEFNADSMRLAEALWPGPLTMVLPKRSGATLPSETTAGLATVAIRIPTGYTQKLIGRYGRPLAAPSANLSGRVTATSATHVANDFPDLDLILNDGPSRVGIESTIVKVDRDGCRLLRPGGLSCEVISEITGLAVLPPAPTSTVLAPGMLASHYAPSALVRPNATSVEPGEAYIGFGQASVPGLERAIASFNLSIDGRLEEAAANLYATLKLADNTGASVISVAPIPSSGLGLAINDRFCRAAAPRK